MRGAEPLGIRNREPEPDELEAVRLILQRRRSGSPPVPFRKIAAELEEAGHKTKRGGKKWYASTVAAVWKRRGRYLGILDEAYDPPRVLVRGRDYF